MLTTNRTLLTADLTRLFPLIVLFFCMLGPAISLAQNTLTSLREESTVRRETLSNIEGSISAANATELSKLRADVRDLLLEIQLESAPIRGQRSQLKTELETLGPAPEAGQPPETKELEQTREELLASLSEYDAAVRQADLNAITAERLLVEISETRQSIFYNDLFQRGPSPLLPESIAEGINGLSESIKAATHWFKNKAIQHRSGSLAGDVAGLAAAITLAFFLSSLVRKSLNQIIQSYIRNHAVNSSRKALIASLRIIVRILPASLGTAIVYQSLKIINSFDLDQVAANTIAGTILLSVLAILVVDSIAATLFFRSDDEWDIAPLPQAKANAARFLLCMVTIVLSADSILKVVANAAGTLPDIAALQSGIVALLLASMTFLLTREFWATSRNDKPSTPDDTSVSSTLLIPTLSRKIAIFGFAYFGLIVFITLVGYVFLAYFVTTRLFFLVGLAVAMLGLRGLLREGMISFFGRMSLQSSLAGHDADNSDTRTTGLTQFWLLFVIELFVLGAFLAPVALVLGASVSDVRDTIFDAFVGFKIGTFTVSVADFLTGVVVFLVLLWLTRMVQRLIDKRLLSYTRIDPGVQDSFRTLIGYAGLVIAALAAIGAIGADLSRLAIVAGALSVGIGFGLQSIVSNFVSGLILLFERPVKVGDWIVVPSGEGFVKRIRVRSTEIETFDSSTVIVPNSELISGTVTNLTLENRVGRVILPVGVSYNADPETVIALLTEIAVAHPKVMRSPAPSVTFVGLGESSMDFELKAFVRDILLGIHIRTDLFVEIVKRCRAEGIEIPFPQRVVHSTESVSGLDPVTIEAPNEPTPEKSKTKKKT